MSDEREKTTDDPAEQPETAAEEATAARSMLDVQEEEQDILQPIGYEAEVEVEDEEEGEVESVEPLQVFDVEQDEADETRPMDWYILKVQSNREDSIADGLRRRVKVAGLDHLFNDVIVPIEKVTEFKGGKKRIVKRKLYPGYIVVNMAINDDSWFLVRDTPGIGDFTGAAGKPTPMLSHEVQRIVATTEEETEDQPKLRISFSVGDRVKINEGNFESFEGEVEGIDEANGRVTVIINIFGRSTPVDMEYWQIESV